jgi:hypothetical protein
MRPPASLPPQLATTPFSTATARDAGVTRARTRSSDLARPFHGIRAHQLSGILDRAQAYAAGMPAGRFFSHFTAAALHGMRLPEAHRDRSLHVTALAPANSPRGRGVMGHRADRAPSLQLIHGLWVTDPVTTWLDCATLLDVDDLIAMADGLVRRKNPVATMDELRDAVARSARRRGMLALRAALPDVRSKTDSPRETRLRLMVVRAGFPEPEVNGEVRNAQGVLVAHGDLVFRKYRTIQEYDGRQHAEDPRQFGIDIRRLDDLMEEKWRVIRVDKSLMARPTVLFRKLSSALTAAGWQPNAR